MTTKKEPVSDMEKLYQKANKIGKGFCRICGRDMYKYDLDKMVIIESKFNKTINLFHRDCIIKEAGGNKILKFTEMINR